MKTGRRRGRKKLSYEAGAGTLQGRPSPLGLYDLGKKKTHFCLSILIFSVRLSVFCCNVREDMKG
jgi:hypothetical protein